MNIFNRSFYKFLFSFIAVIGATLLFILVVGSWESITKYLSLFL